MFSLLLQYPPIYNILISSFYIIICTISTLLLIFALFETSRKMLSNDIDSGLKKFFLSYYCSTGGTW
jgi:hypothetical protein